MSARGPRLLTRSISSGRERVRARGAGPVPDTGPSVELVGEVRIVKIRRHLPGARRPGRDLGRQLGGIVRRASGAIGVARAGATKLAAGMPGSVHATRAGALDATNALQALPDSTLRWLAASSVGLGAGFSLAGAPRLVVAAGVAPAVVMGAAIILRSIEPITPAGGHSATARGDPDGR